MRYQPKTDPLGKLAIFVYRFGNNVHSRITIPGIRHLLWLLYRSLDIVVVRIAAGGLLPAKCRIGKNLTLPHGLNGIILNGAAKIGDNVVIMHQVTVGIKDVSGQAPTIGNGVFIGAGAKVLGPIHVGDGATIGANAVVLHDVPAGATVVGIPAKVVAASSYAVSIQES